MRRTHLSTLKHQRKIYCFAITCHCELLLRTLLTLHLLACLLKGYRNVSVPVCNHNYSYHSCQFQTLLSQWFPKLLPVPHPAPYRHGMVTAPFPICTPCFSPGQNLHFCHQQPWSLFQQVERHQSSREEGSRVRTSFPAQAGMGHRVAALLKSHPHCCC